MAYAKLTLKELKSICKDNHLKNYSSLNKTDLIAFIKKNNKKKQNKKKVGGFDGVLNRETLLKLLGNITEDELILLALSLHHKVQVFEPFIEIFILVQFVPALTMLELVVPELLEYQQ